MKKIYLLCLSRFGLLMTAMAFAGSVPVLIQQWNLSAAQAGTIQSSYNFSYAFSLLIASWLADRFGAKLVYLCSAIATAAIFLTFAMTARSYESGLYLLTAVGLVQGGTYTPALMLATDLTPIETRGRAMGWLLGAASLGYLASTLITLALSNTLGYQAGFYAVALGPIVGATAGIAALARTPNVIHGGKGDVHFREGIAAVFGSKTAVLLTLAYAAHAWEALGMWAWAPAFLSTSLHGNGVSDSLLIGILVAFTVHFSGVLALIMMGEASDRWGRRVVLVATSMGAALLSSMIGWLVDLPPALLLPICFAYGFAVAGDSGVLSAAMTESVHPKYLGILLGLRSILGFGAGALSPVVFGWVLDRTNLPGSLPSVWGWAFLVLAAGGVVATVCTALLPARRVA